MNEQLPKEESDTPRTDSERMWDAEREGTVVSYDFARELERELTEALRSLRREENARKVLTADNDRLRKDADRYRWLRQQKHAHIAASWVVSDEVKVLASGIPGPACIDTAIDAEMERQS